LAIDWLISKVQLT